MDVTVVMAEHFVCDLEAAEIWYSSVLSRPPDVRPMDGLIEWHLAGAGAIQVSEDRDRAGDSSMTIGVTDLDAVLGALDAAQVAHDPPLDATAVRHVVLHDLDGNDLVLTTPLSRA